MVATRRSARQAAADSQSVQDAAPSASSSKSPAPQSKALSAEHADIEPHSAASTVREEPMPSTSSSQRLDPSLFQAYFAKPTEEASWRGILKTSSSASTSSTPAEEAALAREIRLARKQARLEAKRRKERRGGVVLGRDGMPMKRVQDGRTVVRSLASSSQPSSAKSTGSAITDGADQLIQRESALRQAAEKSSARGVDEADRLSTSKSNSFVKRKLGLKGQRAAPTAASQGGKKKARSNDDDDPLGLGDPAFLPGGEFAHLANLTGKGKKRKRGAGPGARNNAKDKSAFRDDALRTSALPRGSQRPALAFARSLAP
ncbi:unnamed protein product [Parajaminaea phylloscopi]